LFLTGATAAIEQATAALGYHFAYDADHDQFAHPAAAFVLNGNGEVTRVLSGLGLSGADLRLALVEAGHGQVGVLTDRFRLLCFGYDPLRGTYTARIGVLLKIAAVLTLAAMAGGFLVLRKWRGFSHEADRFISAASAASMNSSGCWLRSRRSSCPC
jgi:protein SCO1/2